MHSKFRENSCNSWEIKNILLIVKQLFTSNSR